MARDDYQRQLERHAGDYDVLPAGLVLPTLPHGSDWRPGVCRGLAILSDRALQGNRWPAVSGAILAELSRRCATLGALTVVPDSLTPLPAEVSVRFRRAIPVADPRTHPSIADGAHVLRWFAEATLANDTVAVAVRLTRGSDDAEQEPVRAEMDFTLGDAEVSGLSPERRMSDYLLGLGQRLALPAYELGWTSTRIRGACAEPPGSLLGVAEQALGDAGKIIRGDGVPADQEETMLIGSMRYRFLVDDDQLLVRYEAEAGPRTADDRGRHWSKATARLYGDDGTCVGEADGDIVLQRRPG